jgi:hypothetical protein
MFWLCSKAILRLTTVKQVQIQNDSVGKITILRGESISHCEEKISYKHVSNSEWLLR